MIISVLQMGKLRLRLVSCLKVTPLVELIITPDSLVPEPKLFLFNVCLFIYSFLFVVWPRCVACGKVP